MPKTDTPTTEIDAHSFLDPGASAAAVLHLGQQCPIPLSKDLQNQLSTITRLSATDGSCGKKACPWRDNIDSLRLTVHGHALISPPEIDGCDLVPELDGRIAIERLVTRVAINPTPKKGRTEEERGLHAGGFVWQGSGGIEICGQVQGLTNLGTIRTWMNMDKATTEKVTQPCNAQGFLFGRMFGRVTKASPTKSRFLGSRIVALYRFYVDPSYFRPHPFPKPSDPVSKTGGIGGLIEGLLVRPCSAVG